MGFETILNGVWLVLVALSLVVILVRVGNNRSRMLCAVVLGLVVATLFPIISASDDVIRIQNLRQSHGSQRREPAGHKQTNDSLVRLYEAMDSPVIMTAVEISFTLFFVFLIVRLCNSYAQRLTIAESGRSPPVCPA